MSKTLRTCVAGRRPSCYMTSRLEERRIRASEFREQQQKPNPFDSNDFVVFDDSNLNNEYESPTQQNEFLNTSYNFVDFLRSRELNLKERRSVCKSYTTRHVLTHEMLKEKSIPLGDLEKIFSSQWLSNRKIIFGTKCNKLMVYDVNQRRKEEIPTLRGSRSVQRHQHGIKAIEINQSRTLLATTAHHSSNIAVYRLPTLDPVCIGDQYSRDCIVDMCWLDDKSLVSASKNATLTFWQIDENNSEQSVKNMNLKNDNEEKYTTWKGVDALFQKKCQAGQQIRSICFNSNYNEIAVISSNGYIHIFDAETLSQKLSRKLSDKYSGVCLATQQPSQGGASNGLYAVGCRCRTLILDPRTLQPTKMIFSVYSLIGTTYSSVSFQENILTMGTTTGTLLFYDLRAAKFLESSVKPSHTVMCKTSKRFASLVFENQEPHSPVIHTHCYDMSGTRLFVGGGPLSSNMTGNYAAIWQ